MKWAERRLFEKLKRLGEPKTQWMDEVIDAEARKIIEKITKTKFYANKPEFSKGLMVRYNFRNLVENLE